MSRLKELYHKEIVPGLQERFQYENSMQVPALSKIVLNIGVGEAAQDRKLLDGALEDLTRIAGQRPSVRRSKKAISNFKLREGMPVGCMVTLRRGRMYEFLDRFIAFSLPQSRDFRGVSPRGFDGRGNFNLGISEQIIFPEIDYDKVDRIRGMNLTFVTTANTNEEARDLLTRFGMPFSE